MSAAVLVLALTWVSLTAYALLAGADFGAGVWDLLAGSAEGGRARRRLIEHVIGPVWEANHVWLIFVLVLLWTCFPTVFAAIASTLWIPLTLAALGIIARGSAFAFRKTVTEVWQQRLFGATFAASSVITPYFLGTIGGAIAAGDVPPGLAHGDPVTSWNSPVAVLSGVLAVTACAFLAATYLCGEAAREGHPELVAWFRRCALTAGALAGALSLAGLVAVRSDVRPLFDGLTGRALPLVLIAVVAGTGALLLIGTGRHLSARVASAVAVTALVWGWGVAQYPRLLPGSDVASAAAVPTTLHAVLVTSVIGLTVVLPSMWWLLRLFQQPFAGPAPVGAAPGSAPAATAPR